MDDFALRESAGKLAEKLAAWTVRTVENS